MDKDKVNQINFEKEEENNQYYDEYSKITYKIPYEFEINEDGKVFRLTEDGKYIFSNSPSIITAIVINLDDNTEKLQIKIEKRRHSKRRNI